MKDYHYFNYDFNGTFELRLQTEKSQCKPVETSHHSLCLQPCGGMKQLSFARLKKQYTHKKVFLCLIFIPIHFDMRTNVSLKANIFKIQGFLTTLRAKKIAFVCALIDYLVDEDKIVRT